MQEYLPVADLTALYDNEPQFEETLFLEEKVDEKIKGETQAEDSPVGLVPAVYIEPANHISIVKALSDYDANALGELSVNEDEFLLVSVTEDDWLLVQRQNEGRNASFDSGSYTKATSEEEVKPESSPQITIPPDPPAPASTYVDPAHVKVDDIKKSWNAKGTEGVIPASYLETSSVGSNSAPLPNIPEHKEDDGETTQEAKQHADAEGPFPERSRIWYDRSGRFCVEATLLGFNNGKLKLRKLNGVIVAVHSEKMSVQDLQYVEEMTSKAAVEPSSSSSSGHTATDNDGLPPEGMRVWHDRSGQFRVEAAFLGFNDTKLRLQKFNGVIVEVPSEKMSIEDMCYVEEMASGWQ